MTYTEEELNDAVKGCFGVDSRSSLVGLRGGYYVVAEEQYDTSYVYRKLKTIKSQTVKDSDWETLSEIRQGCIRKLFEEGRYEDTLITTCHYEGRVTINYSFNQLDEDRKRKERQARLEKERQEAMDRYNAAVQWARDHGANLRKGKVSKDLMKFRIYKAGLMDEFNKAWPMFAFSEEDVKIASERLIERDIEYLHKPKKSKKDPEQEIRDKYSLD